MISTSDGVFTHAVDYEGLPPNDTKVVFELERRRINATIYYKPAELELGVVEVPEDALTLLREYEVMVNGELVNAKVYVVNATTVNGHPALVEQKSGALVMVHGTVGTFEAGLSVTVYGASSRTQYTARAELVMPNGTVIPLSITWWTPNPSQTRTITISTNTYDLPLMKLRGSTLRMTIPKLGLTILVKIPA